jgi:N-acetylmuramoyl-L-alanine amidase
MCQDRTVLGHVIGPPFRVAIVVAALAACSPTVPLGANTGPVRSVSRKAVDRTSSNPNSSSLIVGSAAPDGAGYWLVASDGGIFAFGDAGFFGSTGSLSLNRAVVGMAATPDGAGYWLVASDGGIFAYGDAGFFGSASGLLQRSAVALVPTPTGVGYRIISADGGVYSYGDALYLGSVNVPRLAGKTIALDPGHDGGNGNDPGYINQPINGGGTTEPCDTAGTATADGYTEHAFNFDVAIRLEALLTAEGATVVMTRANDSGVGPCVDTRTAITNTATVAISIHADSGPPSGSGFDVIEPAPVISSISNNAAIVPASAQLAIDVRNAFASDTGEGPSDYSGTDGIDQRSNLGGLNLSTTPKVLIECANVQHAADAGLTELPEWRQQAALGLADGFTTYLTTEERP